MRTVTTMVAGSTRINDRPDNRWNRDNGFAFAVSQLSSFLSGFRWRVLFCELSVPTAEHLADLIQLYGKSDVLFIVQRFCFPEHQKKHAESVRFLDRETNIRMFLPWREKAGDRYRFYYFHKQRVDALTERMTMCLWQILIKFVPQKGTTP